MKEFDKETIMEDLLLLFDLNFTDEKIKYIKNLKGIKNQELYNWIKAIFIIIFRTVSKIHKLEKRIQELEEN